VKVPAALKPLAFRVIRAVPPLERRLLPSAGYRRIDRAEAERIQAAGSGWKNSSSAAWQQVAYDRLLEQMDAGAPRRDLQVAAEAIDAAGFDAPRVLEVGSGGGYHSAIFAALCRSRPDYLGIDYSEDMIASARKRFPDAEFRWGDATALAFDDAAFDIVFEGVALMHILEYRQAIAEIRRVTASHAIFHCVPVFDAHPTEYFSKYAYGEPVTETVFNRAEIEGEFEAAGLTVQQSWHVLDYRVPIVEAPSYMRTYLCRKTDT
jgi:ubiquinone/menaquinone biosynthesis C-methylase UbiE